MPQSETQAQNFANHRRFDFLFMGAALAFLAGIILALVALVRGPGAGSAAVVALAVGNLLTFFRIRGYPIVVQNRVVRLEMRLRLNDLLTGALKERINELTMSQLVGLRFASDAELPGLMEKVLGENISKADDVKKLVKDWQADTLRV